MTTWATLNLLESRHEYEATKSGKLLFVGVQNSEHSWYSIRAPLTLACYVVTGSLNLRNSQRLGCFSCLDVLNR